MPASDTLSAHAVDIKTTDLRMADGVFAKTMVLDNAGTLIPQHSHVYPHVSVLVRGSVRLWRDGCFVADFQAPVGIFIAARAKHTFQSLADDTIILCVHDIREAEEVGIHEEHALTAEAVHALG